MLGWGRGRWAVAQILILIQYFNRLFKFLYFLAAFLKGKILDVGLSLYSPQAFILHFHSVSRLVSINYMHTSSSFSDDDDPYFQIDLGYVDEIRGLATQGHEVKYWFVRTFTLSFSLDGITWFNYTENGQGTKVVGMM